MAHEFDESDYRLAVLLAGDFKRNRLFKGFPEEDIAQVLAMHLAAKCGEYDPGKCELTSFARTVMNQRGRDLIRAQKAVNATGWREQVKASLDAEVGEDEAGDPLTLSDIVANGRPGVADEAAYRIDREAALATLPKAQREVARRMEVEGKTQAEMAEEMGLPRETFRRRYHAPIRRIEMRLAL